MYTWKWLKHYVKLPHRTHRKHQNQFGMHDMRNAVHVVCIQIPIWLWDKNGAQIVVYISIITEHECFFHFSWRIVMRCETIKHTKIQKWKIFMRKKCMLDILALFLSGSLSERRKNDNFKRWWSQFTLGSQNSIYSYMCHATHSYMPRTLHIFYDTLIRIHSVYY